MQSGRNTLSRPRILARVFEDQFIRLCSDSDVIARFVNTLEQLHCQRIEGLLSGALPLFGFSGGGMSVVWRVGVAVCRT